MTKHYARASYNPVQRHPRPIWFSRGKSVLAGPSGTPIAELLR